MPAAVLPLMLFSLGHAHVEACGSDSCEFLVILDTDTTLQNNTAQYMRHSTLTGYLYFTLLAVPDTHCDNKNAQDA